MTNDWFYLATFTNNQSMTFFAESKELAVDHARHQVRGTGIEVRKVTRLKHGRDVSQSEYDAAGTFFQTEGF